jgi:hypothetical protein
MSSTYFIPFNNRPVSNGATSTGYTVAAGKYQRVTVTLRCNAHGYTNYATHGNTTSGSESLVVSVWLKAGDSISVTGSFTAVSNTTVGTSDCVTAAATATSSLIINSSTAATIKCVATAEVGPLVAGMIAGVSGEHGQIIYYEEYNEIS